LRFVSQFTNFTINIRSPKKKYTEFGVEIVEPEIVAEFDQHGWNQRDMEIAVLSFQFRGIFQNEDEATPVPPTYRLSVYDTDEMALREDWDEETKAFVEHRLLNAASFGRDFVLVQELALSPPWPTYDSFEGRAQDIALQVLDMGFDPEDVIAYESSKWGQQRADVIEALQSAIEARDSGEIIVT
jgi:hypothetical protein